MSYNLFLDDERFPSDTSNKEWVIARSYDEAVAIMSEKGIPSFVSFDHDLGPGLNGVAVVAWMINSHLDGIHLFPKDFQYVVHSQNLIGAKNITSDLTSFIGHILRIGSR